MAENCECSKYDQHVAGRMYNLLKTRGVTQRALARHLEVTPDQARKYLRGENGMTAGSLYKAAEFFEVPISYFYEGIQEDPRVH